MTTHADLRWCRLCAAEVTFEQPECTDEHDEDCPEWVCTRCGDALLVGAPAQWRRAG